MTYIIWILRIIHIVGGVFWVGAALTMTFYIGPTIGATGEAGQKFAGHFIGKMKFSSMMMISSMSSIIAGFLLYWIASNGFTSGWMRSGAGIGFGIGAIFALIGWVFGILIGRTNMAMAKLGSQFQGKPTSEQLTSVQKLQEQLAIYSKINAATLLLAVAFMSFARYFSI